MGLAYFRMKDYEAAIGSYKKAIELNANFETFWNNLAVALRANNNKTESIAASREAIRINSRDARAHLNLGNTLRQCGKVDKAADSFVKAIAINPAYCEAHVSLARIYAATGKLKEAVASYREAIKHKPDNPEIHNALGKIYADLYYLNEAHITLTEALRLKPDFIEAISNLGDVYQRSGQTTQAIKKYEQGLSLKPGDINLLGQLGRAYLESGETAAAICNFRKIIEIEPNNKWGHSQLLFSMHYNPDHDSEIIFNEHRSWAAKHAELYDNNKLTFIEYNKDPDKRLKIGYLSSDFRNHSVAYFLEPFLTHHNKGNFEIFCYSGVLNPDEFTLRFKSLVPHWVSIVGLSPDQIASRIRDDKIDILIDLAGHTNTTSMPVLALKPAPIQISYLGYPHSTGLPTIDYRLTDAYADPPGKSEKWHTEKLIRLQPTVWCYRPPIKTCRVSSLPALNNRVITFGSFNTLPKINIEIIKLWSRILASVPESRLLLKAKCLADQIIQERLTKRFQEFGINKNRIILYPQVVSKIQHFEHYHEVDISLDPYPYNGTTTICEAIWMGVPVITLEGEAHVSRTGVSLLNQVGLEHLIAKTPKEYVHIACSLALDIDSLIELRKTLRERMKSSPLMNERAFTNKLEASYREIWYKWVKISPEL